MTLEDLEKNLIRINKNADECLESTRNKFIEVPSHSWTRYSDAIRTKGNKLLRHNAAEDKWPGERTHYEIDRDQILFNEDFVKLAGKTQVLIGRKNVLYKTRLMHTLEVVQLCRSVAHKTGLNHDLVEAIAYGHDIGHTPFGHIGEATLNACLYECFIRRILGYEGIPVSSVSREVPVSNEFACRDQTLRLMTEWIAAFSPTRDKGELPKKEIVEKSPGKELFAEFINRNIVDVIDGEIIFKNPLTWKVSDELKTVMKNEFWIQTHQCRFFTHDMNALSILLRRSDESKPCPDLTYQTAYGILCHSGRKYDTDFNVYISKDFQIALKQEHYTPEAFLVRRADTIAYVNSDIDDMENIGVIQWPDGNLNDEERKIILKLAGPRYDKDILPSGSRRLRFCEGGFDFSKETPTYDETIKEVIDDARGLAENKLYPVLSPRQKSAKQIIRDLFWFFCKQRVYHDVEQRNVEKYALKHYDSFNKERWLDEKLSDERKATTYIAHLTDDEAMEIHTALYTPEQGPWARYFMEVQQQD